MDFNDLLSFVQQVPLSAAQSAKAGLAGRSLDLQGNAQTIANDQFNKDLALRNAQQLWEQQMGMNQFNLQKAQQDWAQNHAGQEFDLQKAQQEWAQGQGNQDFQLKQRLALSGDARAENQQRSDLADAAANRNLSSIKASQMLQDYFDQLRNKPLRTFTRASDTDNPYSTTNYFNPSVNTAGARIDARTMKN